MKYLAAVSVLAAMGCSQDSASGNVPVSPGIEKCLVWHNPGRFSHPYDILQDRLKCMGIVVKVVEGLSGIRYSMPENKEFVETILPQNNPFLQELREYIQRAERDSRSYQALQNIIEDDIKLRKPHSKDEIKQAVNSILFDRWLVSTVGEARIWVLSKKFTDLFNRKYGPKNEKYHFFCQL
jgi:DNA-binding cell septation regulator SpoVG